MKTLICGSMAYDTMMVFDDRFDKHILLDHLHVLNVSFLVNKMHKDFGGCAGNIAYGLKLLGGEPLIMATMGSDAAPYLAHLDRLGITKNHIKILEDTYTAQCFITTDQNANQITAFHPGAMGFSAQTRVSDAKDVVLGIISPDSKEGMMSHAEGFAKAKIPFVFDPGQNILLFNGEELSTFMKQATYACFNEYEMRLTCEKTGKNVEDLAQEVSALFVTKGAAGSDLYTAGKCQHIAPVKPQAVIDPTGCGDAYRAGLLFGITQGFSLEKAARLASLMGAIKVAHQGTQNHKFSKAEIAVAYRQAFQEDL